LAISFEPFPIGAAFHLSNGAIALVMLIFEQGALAVSFDNSGKVNA
jgi:hypothetical protein